MKTALLVVLPLLASSCVSSNLPPRIPDQAPPSVASLRATVEVEPYRYPVYSRHPASALEEAGVFGGVDAPSALSGEADLVARIGQPVHGTAVVPLFTFSTLGIVPTTVVEEHGFVFSLARPDGGERILVDYRYRGPTTLGWIALFLNNLSPDRTFRDPRTHERFHDGLSAAVGRHRGAIDAMLP